MGFYGFGFRALGVFGVGVLRRLGFKVCSLSVVLTSANMSNISIIGFCKFRLLGFYCLGFRFLGFRIWVFEVRV